MTTVGVSSTVSLLQNLLASSTAGGPPKAVSPEAQTAIATAASNLVLATINSSVSGGAGGAGSQAVLQFIVGLINTLGEGQASAAFIVGAGPQPPLVISSAVFQCAPVSVLLLLYFRALLTTSPSRH